VPFLIIIIIITTTTTTTTTIINIYMLYAMKFVWRYIGLPCETCQPYHCEPNQPTKSRVLPEKLTVTQ
jgi:hypothetical protein